MAQSATIIPAADSGNEAIFDAPYTEQETSWENS